MDSAQNSVGIQTLLDAEREAQKIVQKGMLTLLANVRLQIPPHNSLPNLPDRTKRVKDARTEAQKEIDEYKEQKEKEFKAFEKEHSSGNKKMEDDASKETDGKLDEIKKEGKAKGSKVVDDLLNAVVNVTPEPPSH
ncbi:vacuolar ATPase [Microthyrium microscopicum]|uniref:V-type proton ATPase subunit G n=1 Tax=Microthyrium microscopicum TaxID=703497 RepID=A0A6A6U9F1_9PEZI|nr:vacuolar ATPase [Microthyrium microscopicum]